MDSAFTMQEGEHVVLSFRRHWFMLAARVLGTLVVGGIPYIIFWYLDSAATIPEDMRATNVFAFAGVWWALIVWWTLSLVWTDYYLELWTITNRRVISVEHKGLFDRNVAAWGIERIQEAIVHKSSFWQTFFDFGTLEIKTAGIDDPQATADGIPHPEKAREAIMVTASRIAKLEAENRGKEELLHTLSHEVKSYLARDAAALASIAEGDFGDVPGSVKSIAQAALGETRKGVSAVMEMLQDTDAGRGTMRISRKIVDLKPILLSLLTDFELTARSKGLTLNSFFAEDPCLVHGDETKLRELVFRALIDNAFRYTESGGVRIEVSRKDDVVICTVTDTGVGITESDMARLFTEGGHGEHSRTLNPESTGYGLYYAKKIVEAHGGRIIARSDGAGKGTSFIVGLPASDKNSV